MRGLEGADRAIGLDFARGDLYSYSRWMFYARRGFAWQRAEHHKTICDALMRVFRGECTRLIINVAPRYGKSELAVLNFMSWALGRVPDAEFITTSYSTRLASLNSWQAREIVASDAYREVFPGTLLLGDSKAKDEWRTTAGGCVYAAGTGGTITGYGAGKFRDGFGGAIIIDDPLKPDEATSDVMRKNVIEWFQNTLESRKNAPHTPIIVIMQRVHEEDLAGWLLEGGNGEKWEHINLATLRDDGTALWPAKHTVETLKVMMQASPYIFSAQYQQRPTPPEGGIFKPDEIQVTPAPRDVVQWVRGWDLASSDKDGDYTVGVLMGRTKQNKYLIADVVRLQGRPEVVEQAIVACADRDRMFRAKVSIPQDPGQAGKSQVAYLTKALAGHRVTSSPESGDKIVRAEPFAAQVNIGNVMMLPGEWNAPLIHELRNFPFAKYDDQIDACSRAFNEIALKAKPMNIPDSLLRATSVHDLPMLDRF